MDDLTIKEGLTDNQINQLVDYTNNDLDIQKLTTDKTRFYNFESAKKWFEEKKVKTFVLTDNNQKLLGVIWFHKMDMPKYEYLNNLNPDDFRFTFGVRLYGSARGRGLAVDFWQKCWEQFQVTEDYKSSDKKGLWLGTHVDNFKAISLYHKLGFAEVNNSKKDNRVVMVLKK